MNPLGSGGDYRRWMGNGYLYLIEGHFVFVATPHPFEHPSGKMEWERLKKAGEGDSSSIWMSEIRADGTLVGTIFYHSSMDGKRPSDAFFVPADPEGLA